MYQVRAVSVIEVEKGSYFREIFITTIMPYNVKIFFIKCHPSKPLTFNVVTKRS